MLGRRLLQAGARAHLRGHPGPHGAGRGHRRRDRDRRAQALRGDGAGGDPSIFISLQANTPSIANARHYAEIVEEHALLRRLIGVAGEIADIGYSVPEDVKAAVDEAEQLVFDVGERRTADTMHRCTSCWGRGWTGSRSWASAARTSRAWPRATTSWTGSCSASSPPRSTSWAPVPAWARPASRWGSWPTSGWRCSGRRSCSPWRWATWS